MLPQPPMRADIHAMIRYATLAPSSHNTQPWFFKISDGRILLFADRTRALPVNDPHDRELLISCGCALMNLKTAAAHAGKIAEITPFPDEEEEDLLAAIGFRHSDSGSVEDAHLFPSIEKRRTYRKQFRSEDIPESVLTSLHQAANSAGAWLSVIANTTARERIGDLVSEGDSIQWSDRRWRRELAAWMHPRRKGDGLAVPGLIAPFARMVIRTFDIGDGVGAKDEQLVEGSPVLAVLGTAEDTPAAWLSGGLALQKILLSACHHGLQASYLNQPIQVDRLRPEVQKIAGQSGYPQILLRFGYPAEDIPAAPRRDIADVIED